jgi:hypothetical protein
MEMRKPVVILLTLLLAMPSHLLATEMADAARTPTEPLSVDIKKDWVDQTKDIVDILTLLGVVGGVLTFIVSRKDAKSSSILNRFEKYQNMAERTDKLPLAAVITDLRNNNPNLANPARR